ncbi:DUF4166 domain-containing protein [Agrilutibacter solisilvae]|uniref:DUF4166 domain-containing protein n=1 Tax=Agrilutibacter solisilvae TaxID=2763317 RepID=A0A974Y160_9GAMM|nr:DUF4166 domain-containing protein [Lysobacter solisilvae]QSX78648.1 DUF4166 domain-containing protein [Lysobacter solisilvae]
MAVRPVTSAAAWFGPDLGRLHPALRALHREGGCLEGPARITLGRGLAGLFGRRLARGLGLPLDRREATMRVRVSHGPDGMRWGRAFDDGSERCSVFLPVGHFPGGHWIEQTGAIRLQLAVSIQAGGGWCWQLQAARIGPLPLPALLRPRMRACKRIDSSGRYCFEVGVAWPGLGTLLRYEGVLHRVGAAAASNGVAAA